MQKITISVVLLAAFVYYLTFAPPNEYLVDVEPIAYSNQLFKSFDGPLAHNTILSNAEHLLVNQIFGPESLVFQNGYLYTATFGGTVVRIEGSKVIPIAKIGNGKCDVAWQINKCGRPLGLRFNSKGILYVVDAYHGLYKIESIESKPKVIQLLPLSATENLKGGVSAFFDDITIDEGAGQNGGDVVYISDVSTKWDLSKFAFTLIEHDLTGRLLRFDTDSLKVTVVDDGFVFPNGVQITDDRQSVLVCELGKQRLIRTFITGPKSGKSEIFANLPGTCDNIRRSANTDIESYWVAFASVRNSSNPILLDRLSNKPVFRKFLIRFLYFTGTIMEGLGELFYSETLKSTGYSFKSGLPFLYSAYGYGMITELDVNGKTITAYSSPDGITSHLSEVCEVKGKNNERILYLGSYSNSYLGRLVIKK